MKVKIEDLENGDVIRFKNTPIPDKESLKFYDYATSFFVNGCDKNLPYVRYKVIDEYYKSYNKELREAHLRGDRSYQDYAHESFTHEHYLKDSDEIFLVRKSDTSIGKLNYFMRLKKYIGKTTKEVEKDLNESILCFELYVKDNEVCNHVTYICPKKTNYEKLAEFYHLEKLKWFLTYEEMMKL